MNNEIKEIVCNSIAEEVGLEPGDKVLTINNNVVRDIIDYKFLVTDEELTIEVEKSNGEIWEVEIEKEYDEDLGIVFREAILDKPMSCHNKCVFCFVDQLPEGMRNTLYFKDDDSRLSFLQGNFLTLTNMKDEDIDRIIKYRISPINISVHTTNPELRIKMLNNRFAGNIYDILKRLADAGIKMNTQIVCCPGLNDKEELIRTVEDLSKLYPYVNSVAIVPIGLTKFREGLFPLKLFSKELSKEHIIIIRKLQEKYFKELGTVFARLSDEFYMKSEEPIPLEEHYEDYDQLEDGVGMVRMLINSVERDIEKLNLSKKGSFTFVTGALVYPIINEIVEKIRKTNDNIKINVVKIENDFFGNTITVTGLLTGKDIINTLSKVELGEYIILPDNVIKRGYELFETSELILLDDFTIKDLEKELNRKILICDYTGENLVSIINSHLKED